jgi:uncharacterized protein YkwD
VIFTILMTILVASSWLEVGVASSAQTTLADINSERETAGVRPLVLDDCLTVLASARADDMVQRSYFSHRAPDGRMPWDFMREARCPFIYAGENIAEAPDIENAVAELWHSRDHRRNTLDSRYSKIGIGTATRADGTEVLVEDFTD